MDKRAFRGLLIAVVVFGTTHLFGGDKPASIADGDKATQTKVFNIKDYEIFQKAMERRENVENVLLRIEKYDAQMVEWEKSKKKFLKKEKKNWKWYQRWIGIATPKINYPEELKMPEFLRKEYEKKELKKANGASDKSE